MRKPPQPDDRSLRHRTLTDRDALALLRSGEEAADRVGLPAGRVHDLRDGGALGSAQHGEHLLLLCALARLAQACGALFADAAPGASSLASVA
jgi:hypothetical protein